MKFKKFAEEKSISIIDEQIQEKLLKLHRIIKENKLEYHLKF